MPKFKGDVTHTKTWEGVEVEAESDDAADRMLSLMIEADLDKAVGEADEDVEVDNLEEIDEEEDE